MVELLNLYNMRGHSFVIVLYGLLFICAQFKQYLALIEYVPGSGPQNSETKSKEDKPPMSCYACSTMDYESSTENICRHLGNHIRSSASHPQTGAGHLHYPHQTPIMTTTTTTTTEANEFINNERSQLPHTAALMSSTSGYDDSMSYSDTTTMTTATSTSLSNFMSNSDHPDDSKYADHPNKAQTPYKNSAINSNTTQMAPQPGDRRRIPQNRTIFPGGFIKTRQCLNDENFCSIVSVVRIEFVQDNIYSKFWALERNCSKSCNTGCMVIGERVRLRVCSQCCRTPDCNVGSGAESKSLLPLSSHTNITYLVNLVLSVSVGLMLMFKYDSDMIIR